MEDVVEFAVVSRGEEEWFGEGEEGGVPPARRGEAGEVRKKK